jgi:hypothetical protein
MLSPALDRSGAGRIMSTAKSSDLMDVGTRYKPVSSVEREPTALELYRSRGRRFSAKLVPSFAATILGFLDRNSHFFIRASLKLSSRY